MEKSLYFEYTQKFFPNLVLSIVEKLNEKRTNALSYLYGQYLTPQYSADGRWASITAEYTRVAADVVSLDSELPLKSRDAITTATGSIPKLGLKLYLTEKQMKDLDAMIATNTPPLQIIQNMFADVPRVIEAIYERLEDMFLSELSSGVGVSNRSGGTGVRIDVGYLEANKFGVKTAWTDLEKSTPLDDIQAVFDKALSDQNTIIRVFADDDALTNLYKSKQVRSQYAFNNGIAMTGTTAVPVLDYEKVASVFAAKWGIELVRVARSIKTELNGKKQNHKPWQKGTLAFVCSDNLGDLVWTNCAESTRPVAGVTYQTADNAILVSRYSTNDPLREFTSSQAMIVPIISNVDMIYTVDSTKIVG